MSEAFGVRNIKITDINFSVKEELKEQSKGKAEDFKVGSTLPVTKDYTVVAHVTFEYDSLLRETKSNGLAIVVGSFAKVHYGEDGNISDSKVETTALDYDAVLEDIKTAVSNKVESLLKEENVYATVNSLLNQINLLPQLPYSYNDKTGLEEVEGK